MKIDLTIALLALAAAIFNFVHHSWVVGIMLIGVAISSTARAIGD